jgi:hypothetical protein
MFSAFSLDSEDIISFDSEFVSLTFIFISNVLFSLNLLNLLFSVDL